MTAATVPCWAKEVRALIALQEDDVDLSNHGHTTL